MKATGIIRPIDGLGRVVLPIELRKTLDLNSKDLLEIFVDESMIVLKKHRTACVFCKNDKEELAEFNNQYLCQNCLKAIKKIQTKNL